jgi:small nuclear ribonucleoprotein (snRNP)-like protein
MTPFEPSTSPALEALIGHVVILDLKSSYVCLGTLRGVDPLFFEMTDADLHDFRDSTATREVYVYDSARLGIRRNRARVLVRRDEVVALALFDDIAES